jgi:hypothetical protein
MMDNKENIAVKKMFVGRCGKFKKGGRREKDNGQ